MKLIQGVYLSNKIDLKTYYSAAFAPHARLLELRNPDDIDDPGAVEFALCWEPADDAFDPFAKLRLISSIGAGVDNILHCPSLPPDVPIIRVRDPQQARDMAAFALRYVVDEHRGMARYAGQQSARIWQRNPYCPTPEFRICVLGFGLMGQAVAEALSRLGYGVFAYSKNAKDGSGDIGMFSAEGGKLAAVRDADIVINLLPATPDTVNILDRSVFSAMARGAMLINLGRGDQLVDDDLLEALESGQLRRAALDVSHAEPLPDGHPFWTHPAISVTPHIAAEARKENVARLICEDVQRVWQGEAPVGLIDRTRAY